MRRQLPPDATSVIVLGGQPYVDLALQAFPHLASWAPLQELPARGYGHYRNWLARNTKTTGPQAGWTPVDDGPEANR